jgi:hypothetical protein
MTKTTGCAAVIALALLATPAFADHDRTITDAVGISKMLHAIPALDGDIASRLSAGGTTVQSIRVHPITREDVEDDPLHVAPGDFEIHIFTPGEPDVSDCNIAGSPTLIKRGKRYIPQDRTGVWLLTGRCALPG